MPWGDDKQDVVGGRGGKQKETQVPVKKGSLIHFGKDVCLEGPTVFPGAAKQERGSSLPRH